MRIPKYISDTARDRLVRELAEHSVSYTQLPSDLYFKNFRDILAYIKAEFGIDYCYRCQHLKYPHELNGAALCWDCKPAKQQGWQDPISKVKATLEQQEYMNDLFRAKQQGIGLDEDGNRVYPSNSEKPTYSVTEVLKTAYKNSKERPPITEEYKRGALERHNTPKEVELVDRYTTRILELRCSGLLINQIEKELSMGSAHIYQIIKRDGVEMPPAGFHLDWPILA